MIDLTALTKEAALYEALERLNNNADFKLLINEEYFKELPSQLVKDSGSDEKQSEESQARIKKALDGIGSFNNFLNRVALNGVSAKQSIAAVDAGEFADDEENY